MVVTGMKKTKKVLIGFLLALSSFCIVLASVITDIICFDEEFIDVVDVHTSAVEIESVEKAEIDTQDVDLSVEQSVYTEEELEKIFISMLNINNCYNESLESLKAVAGCAAMTLTDYATDVDGYGICVSSCLVSGFIEHFYGVKTDFEELLSEDAPYGYVKTPESGFATTNHKLISINEHGGNYTVITCMEQYFGGDDLETNLVKSVFRVAPQSDFKFNLIYCEIL